MRVAIQTVTGSTYTSDELWAEEEVTEEEVVEALDSLFKQVYKSGYLTIEHNGRTKYFNPANIVWAQVVK